MCEWLYIYLKEPNAESMQLTVNSQFNVFLGGYLQSTGNSQFKIVFFFFLFVCLFGFFFFLGGGGGGGAWGRCYLQSSVNSQFNVFFWLFTVDCK